MEVVVDTAEEVMQVDMEVEAMIHTTKVAASAEDCTT